MWCVLIEVCFNCFLSSYWSDDGIDLDIQENTNFPQVALSQEISEEEEIDEQRNNVETIGPTTQETTEHAVPVDTGSPGGNLVTFSSCSMFLFLF